MRTPARLFGIIALTLLVTKPCWGIIAVTWLDTPTVLWTEWSSQYEPIDLNNDGITDFMFGAGIAVVGVRAEGDNQNLIWPSGGSNIGGQIEPLSDGFEIGPNSGEGEYDWFGDDGFAGLISCLSGSGGPACIGRFAGQHAYMGVEFYIEGAAHYGWIDIAVAEFSPYAEIYSWGYETDPGVSILAGAGAVPEPSTSMLIIGGLLTIGCTLRRAKARRG